MKKYSIFIILAFFMANLLALGYLNPLGNLSLDEVKDEARIEEEKDFDTEEEKNIERSPREVQWSEDEPEVIGVNIIRYPDPGISYGRLGEHRLVEAMEYRYSDGTTEIVTSDGKILKERE